MSNVLGANASPAVLYQSVNEALFRTFGFDKHLTKSGGVISGVVSIVCQLPDGSAATSVTIGSPVYTNTQAQALISGGQSNTTYLIRCLVSTNIGETVECRGQLTVL